MKFWDYIKGGRKGREAHRIELEAMRDPLLYDAIEGYDRTPGDHDAAFERLRERIAERAAQGTRPASEPYYLNRRRLVRNWSIAAAAVVLVCLSAGGLLLLLKNPMEPPPIAAALETSADSVPDADTMRQLVLAEEAAKEEQSGVYAMREAENVSPLVMSDMIAIKESEIADASIFDSAAFADDEVPVVAEIQISEVAVPSAEPAAKMESPTISEQISGQLAGVAAKETKNKPARASVRGRVVEAGTGEPLAGATVLAERSKTGTITDAQGYFMLPGTESNADLSASYLGYETATMPADTGAVMLIAMNPSCNALGEVVVTGYGTQKKSTIVGRAATVPDDVPADTTTTPAFRRYAAGEIAGLTAENFPEGSATLEFEIDRLGRPVRITVAGSTSPAARREALRILRNGPDWEPAEKKKRITIVFRAE